MSLNDWIETVSLIIIRPTNDDKKLSTSSSPSLLYDYQVYVKKCEQNEHFFYNELFEYEKYPRSKLCRDDFHKSWYNMINSSSSSTSILDRVRREKLRDIPMIVEKNNFTSKLDSINDNPDTVLALRVCANRCLFQELGIISKNSPKIDLKEWILKVNADPGSFRQLLETYPDVCKSLLIDQSSIFEWWNWLTPTTVGRSPRYDTMYYLIILDHQLDSYSTMDSSGHWISLDHNPVMPPSDLYEWKCLQRFYRLNQLQDYLQNDYWKIPLERWLPYVELYQNGSISFLPGDQAYPKEPLTLVPDKPPRMKDNQTLEMQLIERKFPTKSINRIEHRGFHCKIIVQGRRGIKQQRQQKQFIKDYHWPADDINDNDSNQFKSKL